MPCSVKSAVGRDIWSKILEKTVGKYFQTRLAVLKPEQCSTGSQCNFIRTCVILVYLLVFDMIQAALFWMHCNLRRLNLERFLKIELQ